MDGASLFADDTNGVTIAAKSGSSFPALTLADNAGNGGLVANSGSASGVAIDANAIGAGAKAIDASCITGYGVYSVASGSGTAVYGEAASGGSGVHGKSISGSVAGVKAEGVGTAVAFSCVNSSSGVGGNISTASGTGRALQVTGNDTKAPVRIVGTAEPTDVVNTLTGDMYVNEVTGQLIQYNGEVWAPVVQKVKSIFNTIQETTTTGAYTLFDDGTNSASYTIDADTLRIGSTIRVRASFKIVTNISGAIGFRIVFGGPTGTTLAESTWGAGTFEFVMDLQITVGALGTTGNARFMRSLITEDQNGSEHQSDAITSGIDTEVQNNLVAAFYLTNAGDVVECHQFDVDISG
jgi:hypothetical protein